MLRKLPLSGVQTFADIVNDFAVYVDKTAYIHKNIKEELRGFYKVLKSSDRYVKLQKNVFVIEAKLDKPVEKALNQIEEKKYYVSYLEKGCNIFKIGVVFGEKERNVMEWKAA